MLAEDHDWLRKISISKLRNPGMFWRRMEELVTWSQPLSAAAEQALVHLLPRPDSSHRVVRRTAGPGSLGDIDSLHWQIGQGGRIAREAKALAPSACSFAKNQLDPLVISKVYWTEPFA